ncbi:hypothetical protein FIBSPDRAFT_870432, partial [Athelia psychrophila]
MITAPDAIHNNIWFTVNSLISPHDHHPRPLRLSTETRATEELGRLETVASPVASPLVPVRLHIITHPSLDAP